MKKILLLLSIISFSSIITAQVKVNQNAANSAINTSSAFMDASSSPLWNGTTNQGKGMLYPRVDLVNYTAMSHAGPFNASNNPNYFDGLLVFNTATGVAGIGADSVFPGYYYYRNTTTTANGGHWVSLKGIKGDDGSIGPIGPQGVQGITGNDGLVGPTGAQGPTGVAGANGNNGSTGATGAQGPTGLTGASGADGTNGTNGVTGPTGANGVSSGGSRIGFSSSTTWTCPAGVTSITIEVWGASGGAGGGSPYGSNASATKWFGYCLPSGYPILSAKGGDGGQGGYNKIVVSVVPGNTYSVTIGTGGSGGNGGVFNAASNTITQATNGNPGGASSFTPLLTAPGGTGGTAGTCSVSTTVNPWTCCHVNGIYGTAGTDGAIINNNSSILTPSYSPPRTYIPGGYSSSYISPSYFSPGGIAPQPGLTGSGFYVNGPFGGSGENGFCVIAY